MHEIQQGLLQIIQERSLKEVPPLRALAKLIGKNISAQQVKHHLQQLEKKGFISINQKTKAIEILSNTSIPSVKSSMVSLPIYGVANCGPALSIAEQRPVGFLKVSSSLLKTKKLISANLFVVKASGDSMNKASIDSKTINDGDYLIVDSSKKSPKGVGEIVLSIIDGSANVKKIYKDEDHIILASDSTQEYPPIYINSKDDFLVNGLIVGIFKKPLIKIR